MLICRAVVTLDRVFERPFPWPHDPGLENAPIRHVPLRGSVGDVEVGTFLGQLCDTNHAGFGDDDELIEDIEAIFDQLCSREDLIVPGGIGVWSDGEPILLPGCCCGLEGWREWIAFLDAGAAPPWCGHTPDAFFERLPEERLCFGREGSPGTRLETSSAELRAALRVAESDLVAFKETLEGWVRRMAPAHEARLVPCLDAAFQFTGR